MALSAGMTWWTRVSYLCIRPATGEPPGGHLVRVENYICITTRLSCSSRTWARAASRRTPALHPCLDTCICTSDLWVTTHESARAARMRLHMHLRMSPACASSGLSVSQGDVKQARRHRRGTIPTRRHRCGPVLAGAVAAAAFYVNVSHPGAALRRGSEEVS